VLTATTSTLETRPPSLSIPLLPLTLLFSDPSPFRTCSPHAARTRTLHLSPFFLGTVVTYRGLSCPHPIAFAIRRRWASVLRTYAHCTLHASTYLHLASCPRRLISPSSIYIRAFVCSFRSRREIGRNRNAHAVIGDRDVRAEPRWTSLIDYR